MASLAALLLLASAPAPAATPPAPSVSAIGIARARILRPVTVTRLGESITPDYRQTHQSPRRDGARVVDLY